MAVNSTAEWVVDTGTPRHSEEEFPELFIDDQDESEDSEVQEDPDEEAKEEAKEEKEEEEERSRLGQLKDKLKDKKDYLKGKLKDKKDKLKKKIVGEPRRKSKRGMTLWGGEQTRVTVVAPGAGVGMNGKVYAEMKQDPTIRLRIEGRSGMPYDRYTAAWPQGGAPPPNLESFAEGIMSVGVVQDTDCFIFGSRGGQVVLPTLWKALGDTVPPAVVINGGCAIDMPITVHWPTTAVTFLILGGQDYFKKPHFSPQQFVEDAQKRVSRSNSTTAILYVQEMAHMPPPALLTAILRPAISGLLSWKATGQAPTGSFEMIANAVKSIRMSARLLYTSSPGAWQEVGGAPGTSTTPAALPAQVQYAPTAPSITPKAHPPQLGYAPTASMIRSPMPPTPIASQALVGQPPTPTQALVRQLPTPIASPGLVGLPQTQHVAQLVTSQTMSVQQMGPRTMTLPATGPSPIMLPPGAQPAMFPAGPSPTGPSPVMLPPGMVLRR